MVAIRNWKDSTPVVSHESAIVFWLFREKGAEGYTETEAPLEGMGGLTLHMMQGGKSGDYHVHDSRGQLYYFTKGRGKMKIDDVMYDVKEGDAVYVPANSYHQLVNDSDDWIEHLIVNGKAE
jgi:mannose-6-phosphate isomerase-like protein (cupin superfamily)